MGVFIRSTSVCVTAVDFAPLYTMQERVKGKHWGRPCAEQNEMLSMFFFFLLFQVCRVGQLVHRQISSDVFLIDWEKVHTSTIDAMGFAEHDFGALVLSSSLPGRCPAVMN